MLIRGEDLIRLMICHTEDPIETMNTECAPQKNAFL